MDTVKTGRFISELRQEKGYSQIRLAEMLNISNKTVSKWERGNGFPDVSLMMPLCDALGISLDELVQGERLPQATKASEQLSGAAAEGSQKSFKELKPIISRKISDYNRRTGEGKKTAVCLVISLIICLIYAIAGLEITFSIPGLIISQIAVMFIVTSLGYGAAWVVNVFYSTYKTRMVVPITCYAICAISVIVGIILYATDHDMILRGLEGELIWTYISFPALVIAIFHTVRSAVKSHKEKTAPSAA